jgi:alpha-beta hydrolase superfamily lysophospholipase
MDAWQRQQYKNQGKMKVAEKNSTCFFKTKDSLKLFIYDFIPDDAYTATIFMIAGITGINHHSEKESIELLSNNENRVVVIHPRGTGNSEGIRGDIESINLFINDYVDIIKKDSDYISSHHPVYLFGHSMSCAVLVAVADKLKNSSGAILINPPLIQKAAKGMSPNVWQYLKYAFYMLFAKHRPIVNMAGNPSLIQDKEDRKEAEQRANDKLLVQYFSMHYMNEVRKLLKSMPDYAAKAAYPLLLIYGMKDSIVDKKGCDLIYENWKHKNKTYHLVENGTHGKSTIQQSKKIIIQWLKK